MSIKKRYGRHYYTDFSVHGKRIVQKIRDWKFSGGIANLDIAQQYKNDLKLKMLKGEIGIYVFLKISRRSSDPVTTWNGRTPASTRY